MPSGAEIHTLPLYFKESMTEQDPTRLIGRKDAAAFLKMTTRHFDREARRRGIALTKAVRSVYITREQLMQWHAVRFPEARKPQTRLNLREAAKLLRCGLGKLRSFIKAGEIPAFREGRIWFLLYEDIMRFNTTSRERAEAKLKADRASDVRPETLQEIANYRPPLPSVKLPYQDDEDSANPPRPQGPTLSPSPIDRIVNEVLWAREAGRINEHTTNDPEKLKRMRALLPRLAPKRTVSCGSAGEIPRFPGFENPY
jgi:excisionase family DNA binding protein